MRMPMKLTHVMPNEILSLFSCISIFNETLIILGDEKTAQLANEEHRGDIDRDEQKRKCDQCQAQIAFRHQLLLCIIRFKIKFLNKPVA